MESINMIMIQSHFFSSTGLLHNANEPAFPNNLPTAGGRRVRKMCQHPLWREESPIWHNCRKETTIEEANNVKHNGGHLVNVL